MKKKKSLKELFKNKKFRVVFIIVILLIIALSVFLYYKFSDKSVAVETAEVKKGTVKQYYDTTGTLATGETGEFELYEGVIVKEVKVKSGDTVKEGDILATFDTSSMNAVISEKKKALNAATEEYNNAVAGNTALQEATTAEAGTGPSLTNDQIEAVIAASGELTEAQKQQLRQQLSSYNETGSIPQMNNGQFKDAYKQNMENAKAEYNDAVAEKKKLDEGFVAKKDGKVVDVNIKAGEEYVYVAPENNNQGILSVLSGTSPEVSNDVSSIVSGVLNNNSGTETAKKGIAMTVDYYEGYRVEFTLGKYDVQKITLDMPAIVEYTDFKYTAKVTKINARADNGSNDFSSLTSSMMGGGSNSSSSGAGVAAEATITNPNDKLVIGFDTKISILTAEHKDVLTIPVESLVIEDGKKFVYTITKDMKAKKTLVETGASSETQYEVTKGLKAGQKVIVNSSEVTDGTVIHVGEK